jgi:hypothetical protein
MYTDQGGQGRCGGRPGPSARSEARRPGDGRSAGPRRLVTEHVKLPDGGYAIYQSYLACPGCLGYTLEVSTYKEYDEDFLEAYCLVCGWALKGLDTKRGLEEQIEGV